jgi:hypothetical protein
MQELAWYQTSQPLNLYYQVLAVDKIGHDQLLAVVCPDCYGIPFLDHQSGE